MLTNPENLNNLVPICANSKVALDFIQAANSMPIANERVATVALVYTTAAAIVKTGNISVNGGMGAVIAEFVRYMASNSSNVPFLPLALQVR